MSEKSTITHEIESRARSLNETDGLKELAERLSQSRIVFLGTCSHGMHEAYFWRRLLSAYLITQHGYKFAAVEADWWACWELNEYVHGRGIAATADRALRFFRKWPSWLWANSEVERLVEWLKSHNSTRPEAERAGFYGLDVYAYFEAVNLFLKQIEMTSPPLARKFKERFEHHAEFQPEGRPHAEAQMPYPEGCADEAVIALEDLIKLRVRVYAGLDEDRTVKNAEPYYRTMLQENDRAWSIRDRHMLGTLEHLLESGPDTRAIVWAHDAHVGDYRANSLGPEGFVNLGGLAREKWGEDAVTLVGMGTHRGETLAARTWGGEARRMPIEPAPNGTVEAYFHEVSRRLKSEAFSVSLRGAKGGPLSALLPHRLIGTVYRDDVFVPTRLADRYDEFIYIDECTALEPLEDRPPVAHLPRDLLGGL